MAGVKIAAEASGGSAEIAGPPSSSANTVLKLPADTGSAGQVLKVKSANHSATNAELEWAADAGGKILQIISNTKTDTFSTTSTSFVDIDGTDEGGSGSVWEVNITPSSSSNKILVSGLVTFGGSDGAAYSYTFKLMRDSTAICIADAAGSRERATFGTQGFGTNDATNTSAFQFLDSPSTTSAIAYKIQARAESPKTLYVNRGAEGDGDNSITPRFTSTITVMEVSA
jgi:hypothetical protein